MLSWSLTICFFVALYFFVCSCPKISRNAFFIYNYSHFLYSFWNQRVLFAQPEGKQTMEQQPHRVCEWKKSKQKQNHVTFKLSTRFIVCFKPTNNAMVSLKDGFIVWHHSQKKIVNNMLLAWCLLIPHHSYVR